MHLIQAKRSNHMQKFLKLLVLFNKVVKNLIKSLKFIKEEYRSYNKKYKNIKHTCKDLNKKIVKKRIIESIILIF
jgi:hypothetical protein